MQVSKSEFARLKALVRKAKRIDRIADNLALSVAGTQAARQEPSKQPQDAPGRAWGSRDATYPIGPQSRRKARIATKPCPISIKLQIKAIKKRILGTGGLWSQAVRKRDRACVMCYKVDGLQAHHWFIRRSHSMALAVDIANGATLCYSCHIGRAHREADADFILALASRMVQIVGDIKMPEMRAKAKHPEPLGLDFWEEAESKLKNFMGAL